MPARILNVLLMAAVFILVLDVVWGVFTRKVLGAQADFTEEMAKILLVWVALLGGAAAFRSKAHLGVDCFVNLFAPQARKWMAVVVQGIVLAFAIIIFLVGGVRVVIDQLNMEQLTPALGWKMGYVYLAIPLAGFFMVFFTIEHLVKAIQTPAEPLEEATDSEGAN